MSAQTSFIHFHPNVYDLKLAFAPQSALAAFVPAVAARPPAGAASEPVIPAAAFARWVLESARLDGEAYRAEPLVRRVPACLRALGVSSLEAARAKIARSHAALSVAVNTILVGVTEFYRDFEAFEDLERQIDARPDFFHGCRAWSAGCSIGAEGYTLAILLQSRGLLQGGYVQGTDCRISAVETARTACFASSLCARMPQKYRAYLREEPGLIRLDEAVVGQTRWFVEDLLNGALEPERFHLVACRNVSIYLNQSTIHGLWARLYDSLLPGGLLFTGHAEVPVGCGPLVRVARCLYRKESRVSP